jgi:CXC domain
LAPPPLPTFLFRKSVADYKREVRNYARDKVRNNLDSIASHNAADSRAVVEFERIVSLREAGAKVTIVTPHGVFDSSASSIAFASANSSAISDAQAVAAGAAAASAGYSATAAIALLNITLNPMRSSRGNRASKRIVTSNDMIPFWMIPASPVPRYDAWVPVNKEFWVGNDFLVEPYMPWFGDEEDKRGNAFELYRRMAKLAKDDTQVSDGELDDDGNFCEPPDDEEAWRIYESAKEQRRRAACRAAISVVVEAFGRENPAVFLALADALQLGDPRRVAKMLEITEIRHTKSAAGEASRKAAEAEAKRVANAWTADVGYDEGEDDEWYVDEAEAPLVHFCFTCHVFHCLRHLHHNVEPIVPIKDTYVEVRNGALKRILPVVGKSDVSLSAAAKVVGLKPCGAHCFMADGIDLNPQTASKSRACESWTKEERMLCREGVSIFKKDPCNIAVVIGNSKTCSQVAAHLSKPDVAVLANKVIVEATKKRWPLEINRGGRMSEGAELNQSMSDEDSTDTVSKSRFRKLKSPSSGALGRKAGGGSKSVAKVAPQASEESTEDTDVTQEADFVPCAHLGPCDKAHCSCYTKSLKCEATCGCNTGRWTSRGYENPGGKGVSDKKKVCKLRHWGCTCAAGSHCNTSACACWEDRRSCDPDFCDRCAANILPSQIASDERGCRNVGVPIGRHKRTIVGKSVVHGFGLFAGEVFEEGDLVGIYGGQIMDTKKADSLGFLYDAKDHTFFFDVTQSLVVDGGVLGMKSKFVNHVQGGSPEENCISRCVRVRGMAHIALFAMRRVETGEEFRFDYKFQVVVPDWAQHKSEASNESTPERKPETPGRFVSGKGLRSPIAALAVRNEDMDMEFGDQSDDD